MKLTYILLVFFVLYLVAWPVSKETWFNLGKIKLEDSNKPKITTKSKEEYLGLSQGCFETAFEKGLNGLPTQKYLAHVYYERLYVLELMEHDPEVYNTTIKDIEESRTELWKKCMSLVKVILSTEPCNAEMHFINAQYYYENKKYEESIKSIEKTVKFDPQNADYLAYCGIIYFNCVKDVADKTVSELTGMGVDEYLKSSEYYSKKAIEINPYHYRAWLNLVDTYWVLEKYSLALETCDKGIEMFTKKDEEEYKTLIQAFSEKKEMINTFITEKVKSGLGR